VIDGAGRINEEPATSGLGSRRGRVGDCTDESSREPKGAVPSGLRSEERSDERRATSKNRGSRAPGGERDSRWGFTWVLTYIKLARRTIS
jgi:hypothetical protein